MAGFGLNVDVESKWEKVGSREVFYDWWILAPIWGIFTGLGIAAYAGIVPLLHS